MKDRFKRGAAWITTAVTLASSVFASVPAASASTVFNDVPGTTSYYQGIMWAYDHGILQGYGNGNFGPDDCVRRSELAKMIVNYTHTGSGLVGAEGSDPGFSDVPSVAWYYPFVKEARYKNYLQGYPDGSFRPNVCVNRAEAMKVASNALLPSVGTDSSGSPMMYDNKLVTDVDIYAWYAPFARVMFKNRLMGTDHTTYDPSVSSQAVYAIKFYPAGSMTRKEVAEMLYRISTFMGSNPTPAPSPSPSPSPSPTDVNLTYQAPVTNYTSMPSQINFQWTANVTGATLVLEYRDPNNIGTIMKTSRFSSASGYSKTLSLSDYQTDFNNYKTFCWKLEKTGTNYLSSTNGYPCVSYTPQSTTNVNITYQAPNTTYTSMPSQLDFQWSANVTDSTLVLEYRDPNNISTITKTVRYSSTSGSSRILYSGDYQTDFTNYKTFCWKLEKAGTNYLSSTNGYPCVTYAPPSTTNVNITYQAPVSSYTSMPSQITFQWSANVSDSTLVLEYRDPNNVSTVVKTVKYSSTSGYSRILYLGDYQTDFTNYKTFCWKLEKTGTNYLSSTNGYPCVSYTPVALTAPVLLAPSMETVYHGNSNIGFVWSPVAGASYYVVQIRTAGSSSYYFNQNTTSSSYSISQSVPSVTTTYYWRVVAYDALGNSMASTERMYLVGP